MQSSDFNIGGVVGKEENRAVKDVVWIKDLGSGEAIPPCLTISIDNARSIDLDIPGLL